MQLHIHIMKRKLNKSCSTILPISTKPTTSTHWIYNSPQHINLEIKILSWDRQTTAAWLNLLIRSQPPYITKYRYNYSEQYKSVWKLVYYGTRLELATPDQSWNIHLIILLVYIYLYIVKITNNNQHFS